MAGGKKASIRAVDPEVVVICSLEGWYPSLTDEEREQIAECVLEEIWN